MYRTRPFPLSFCVAAVLALAACGDEPEAGNGTIDADVGGEDADVGGEDADVGGEDVDVGGEDVDVGGEDADAPLDTRPDAVSDVVQDASDGGDADLDDDANADAGFDVSGDADLADDAVPDLPTCADIDCGEAACEIELGVGAVCTCDEGYAFDAGACEIALFIETDFSDPRWVLVGGGTVDDTGAYLGTPETACERFGVETEVELPAERPEGTNLVLEVTFRTGECEDDACLDTDLPSLFLALGTREFPFRRSFPSAGSHTDAFCLGDHAFSEGAQTLRLGTDFTAEEGSEACTALDFWLAAVDSVSIRAAEGGECPEGYGVENGDFEAGDLTGWTLDASGLAAKGVIDLDGDGVLAIGMNAPRCDQAILTQAIDVPTAARTAPLALRAVFDFASGAGYEAGYTVALSDGQGVSSRAEVSHYGALLDGNSRAFETCLPYWAYGKVIDLSMRVYGTGPPVECTAEVNATFTVHGLTLVEREACATDGSLDETFEAGLGNWWTGHYRGNSGADTLPALVEHGGEEGVYLRMAAPEVCSGADVRFDLPLGAGEEAVVRFRYRAFEDEPGADNANVGPGGTSLPTASEWTSMTTCLRGDAGTQNVSLSFYSVLSGLCANPYSAYLEIDDVVVDRDAACPEP